MTEFVRGSILRKIYGRREPWVHKGRYGRLTLICGSESRTGSACFAGMAAYRAGADLVYVVAPHRAADVAANFSPVLMTTPLSGDHLVREHEQPILDLLEETGTSAGVIGPGLWRNADTLSTIRRLLRRIKVPMVLDADAIRAVGELQRKFAAPPRSVFTPHANEFKALTGVTVTTDLKKRTEAVTRQAARLKTVILLKGHVDIVSDGDSTFLNSSGSPYMTKGGLGDTLAGICGAYLARGVEPLTAACAAAYVNGRAGTFASRPLGESLLPIDLIEKIPEAIRA